MSELKGTSLVGGSVSRERVENDYYATPPEATRALLNSFGIYGCFNILEPACGEGHISKEIVKWFNKTRDAEGNKWDDEELVTSTDLIDRGYGTGGIDFLRMEENKKYDCVITNPPFKLAKEFILKALKLSKKYVIMFAKIQLLEGIGRRELFEKYPPKYIYVFRNRINPMRNGSSVDENGKKWSNTMCFAWFVWEIGFEGEPTIRWLQTNLLQKTAKASGDKK